MKIEIAFIHTHTHTKLPSTNPKSTNTGHTHGSMDEDFDAVQTVVLCDNVINDNDKAPRPEVAIIRQKKLWISDVIVIITGISY